MNVRETIMKLVCEVRTVYLIFLDISVKIMHTTVATMTRIWAAHYEMSIPNPNEEMNEILSSHIGMSL